MISIHEFLEMDFDGVYYTGHASIIARINRKNFLFDYVKDSLPYGDRWRFFPALVDNVPIKMMDGIFVSHVHQDHFDPGFLTSREIQCPIYVIGGRSSFEQTLTQKNIDYVKIPPGKKTEISAGIYVYGFLHDSNGVDASCCIGNRDFSVYHGNDNYLNNANLATIDPEFSNIDVACIPYAYINWYPQLLENLSASEKKIESERLCNHYFEYAIEQARQLRARQIIPFGANLVYRDHARSPMNLECKTPLDFQAYVRRTRGETEANRFKALFSGDLIVKDNGALAVHCANVHDDQSYRDRMQDFLTGLEKNSCAPTDADHGSQGSMPIDKKIKTTTAYDHYICVSLRDTDEGVMINTKNSVSTKMDFDLLNANKIGYHNFRLSNPSAYFKWLSGAMSIEEIIGTRELTVFRNPNTYNKEILFIATTQL